MPTPARTLTHNGATLAIEVWAARLKLAVETIRSRLDRLGWSVADALDTPPDRRFRRGGRHPADAPRPCPALKAHPDGRAWVRWKEHGIQRARYFGRYGSDAARAAYRRFAGEWAAGAWAGGAAPDRPAAGLTVAGLVMQWIAHTDREYVKDGRPTSERHLCRAAVARLADDYGADLAAEFLPAKLRAVRSAVAADVSRTTANAYASRIVRMFGWAVGNSLVPPAVAHALAQVEAIKPGRGATPDRERRKPATPEQIKAALPFLSPRPDRRARLAAMVELQRLTGMRPGEVCALAVGDLDRGADVWLYTVGKANKNRHRGRAQTYYLGPRARKTLAPFLLGADPIRPVFGIGRCAYGRAVQGACRRAKCAPWTPHQLRHSLATAVAERFRSLEHAAAAIGDSKATAAAVYVHVDPQTRAKIEVARAMG